MHETDVLELQPLDLAERDWVGRLRILRRVQDLPEIRQRYFGLAENVDDVSHLLQRAEDEERIEQQREELTDGDLLGEDQVQHHEQDAGAKQVYRRSLDEAE